MVGRLRSLRPMECQIHTNTHTHWTYGQQQYLRMEMVAAKVLLREMKRKPIRPILHVALEKHTQMKFNNNNNKKLLFFAKRAATFVRFLFCSFTSDSN